MNLQLQKDLKHKFSNDHYAVNNGKQSRILRMKRKKSARKTKQNKTDIITSDGEEESNTTQK